MCPDDLQDFGPVGTNGQCQAATSPPPTRWQRFVKWTRVHDFRLYMVPGYGAAYRTMNRVSHRYGWHHTHRLGPMWPCGTVVEKCSWCGIQRVVTSNKHREFEAQLRGER